MFRPQPPKNGCSHGRVSNENQLLPILFGAGFEKIIPEALSFDEQVALFQGAECIAGAHGAGLTNIIFSSPGCQIIEIRNPTCNQNETYQSRGASPRADSELMQLITYAKFAISV